MSSTDKQAQEKGTPCEHDSRPVAPGVEATAGALRFRWAERDFLYDRHGLTLCNGGSPA